MILKCEIQEMFLKIRFSCQRTLVYDAVSSGVILLPLQWVPNNNQQCVLSVLIDSARLSETLAKQGGSPTQCIASEMNHYNAQLQKSCLRPWSKCRTMYRIRYKHFWKTKKSVSRHFCFEFYRVFGIA